MEELVRVVLKKNLRTQKIVCFARCLVVALVSELGISCEKLVEGLLGAKHCFVFFIRSASMSLGSSLERVFQSLLDLAEVGILHQIQKSISIDISVALSIVLLSAVLFVRRNIARERVNGVLDSLKISRSQSMVL